MNDLGLYHGKMGIVLFFAHYARYTGEAMYDDFAGELLDEVYEEIHTDLPINFEYGLCGIGWGIEYLFQNRFIEGDSNSVLEDVDKKIMERDVLRITDKSFETGLVGISLYVKARIKGRNLMDITFDNAYLENMRLVESQIKKTIPKDVLSEILKDSSDHDDILKMKLGLNNGCSGMGLKTILQ